MKPDPVKPAPLTDDVLVEALAFVKAANPFVEYTWGWETGRFIDFRWAGNNVLRRADDALFFEKHCTLLRRGDNLVGLIVAEYGRDDHCILTQSEDPATVDWAVQWLLDRRDGQRLTLYPSDEATWVHEVLEGHGFARGDVAEMGWGFDLGDVPDPFEPEGFVVEPIRGPEDFAGIDRCLSMAFGRELGREAVLESLAGNPVFLPELSVVARAANGDVAAYCRGTVDANTGVGSIDPVATRPDYQRRGLGKAVVLRCFDEQRRHGGTMSFIGSGPRGSDGSQLYEKLNPASITSYSEWAPRELPATSRQSPAGI
ncbi:MAG: GNAT family N-acetyltransferase [Acidimicrobiia bacterium]|nr:GNAT family N-acetyltransferase [Acidimicrobiia bacterium]